MYKIQTLNEISTKGLGLLDMYSVASKIDNPDAILVRSNSMIDMDIPKSVKVIARAGAGVNNIPINKCTENGIVVFNTPGANANSVKELVLTALFLSSRKIIDGILWTQNLTRDISHMVEKGKSHFSGVEIKGKTLGVIGLGAVGIMVANSAIDLGMEVIGYDPFADTWKLNESVDKVSTIDALIARSDYITLHIPLNNNTKGIINFKKFNLMKKFTRLLNFSRGGLVNNADLIRAINENTIGVYVTDFPEEQLLNVDNIIQIPHLGASTVEAEDNCAIMAANRIKDYLESGKIEGSVNFPNCTMLQKCGTHRITIINRNIPNMVLQIAEILSWHKNNIENMINKNKNDIAYNIIDTNKKVSKKLINKIEDIYGVISVMVLKKEGK